MRKDAKKILIIDIPPEILKHINKIRSVNLGKVAGFDLLNPD